MSPHRRARVVSSRSRVPPSSVAALRSLTYPGMGKVPVSQALDFYF